VGLACVLIVSQKNSLYLRRTHCISVRGTRVRTHCISEEQIVSQKDTLYLSSWDLRAYSYAVLDARVYSYTHTHTHFLHALLRQKANIHEFMRAFSVAWVHVY
jgi:hypothetical protein